MKRTIGSIILTAALFCSLSIPAFAADYGRITLSGENYVYERSQVTVVFEEARMETRTLSVLEYGEEVHDYENQKVILVKPNSTITITDSVKGNETDFWPYYKADGNVLGGDYPRGWTGASGNVSDWVLGKSLMGGGDIVAALSLALTNEAGQEEDYTIMLDEDGAAAKETPSSWAVNDVNTAISAGIVPEALQSRYTAPATRAEFCALATALYETKLGEIGERSTFTDTKDVQVEKMAALGVVNGVGNGKFNPDGKLTREQAATMLARLAAVMGKPIGAFDTTFADKGSISSWALDAVGQMQTSGVMNGTGNNAFSPKKEYSREQSIVTMLRMMRYADTQQPALK